MLNLFRLYALLEVNGLVTVEYVIEIANEDLNEEDIDNFGVESCDGHEEDGEKYRIIIPADYWQSLRYVSVASFDIWRRTCDWCA